MVEGYTVYEQSGIPTARVAAERAWNLIEYLAVQRVQVRYSFQVAHLIVSFDTMTSSAVGDLLAAWAQNASSLSGINC